MRDFDGELISDPVEVRRQSYRWAENFEKLLLPGGDIVDHSKLDDEQQIFAPNYFGGRAITISYRVSMKLNGIKIRENMELIEFHTNCKSMGFLLCEDVACGNRHGEIRPR